MINSFFTKFKNKISSFISCAIYSQQESHDFIFSNANFHNLFSNYEKSQLISKNSPKNSKRNTISYFVHEVSNPFLAIKEKDNFILSDQKKIKGKHDKENYINLEEEEERETEFDKYLKSLNPYSYNKMNNKNFNYFNNLSFLGKKTSRNSINEKNSEKLENKSYKKQIKEIDSEITNSSDNEEIDITTTISSSSFSNLSNSRSHRFSLYESATYKKRKKESINYKKENNISLSMSSNTIENSLNKKEKNENLVITKINLDDIMNSINNSQKHNINNKKSEITNQEKKVSRENEDKKLKNKIKIIYENNKSLEEKMDLDEWGNINIKSSSESYEAKNQYLNLENNLNIKENNVDLINTSQFNIGELNNFYFTEKNFNNNSKDEFEISGINTKFSLGKK